MHIYHIFLIHPPTDEKHWTEHGSTAQYKYKVTGWYLAIKDHMRISIENEVEMIYDCLDHEAF